MAISHDVILLVYLVATLLGTTLSAVVWRHREKTGAIPLAVVLFAAVFWAGPLFVATVADGYATSAFMTRFLYVGVGMSVLGTVVFALEYTGRERLVSRRTVALLSVEPVAVVALAFWNPENVFFETLEPDSAAVTGVGIEFGIAFGFHLVYSYLLLFVAAAMILEFLYSSRSLYRGQAASLLGASIVPLAMNAIYVFGGLEADITPIGFVVAGALYAIAIVRYRLIDVTPIAHRRVLDTISDGVFVVDRDDRLTAVNPAGRRLLGVDDDASIVGRRIDSFSSPSSAITDLFTELTATTEESSAELEDADSYYTVRATPIDDGRDRHVGWLLIVTDVTDRTHRERELTRQNERLDEFASLVSHDLRNPLNVADGYVGLTRDSGDVSHLEEVDRAHERMQEIIDDVLALARDGDGDTKRQSVSVSTLAERAWENVETDAASITFASDVRIRADPSRTVRLFENLIRNAVEHGTGDGTIRICVGSLEEAGPKTGFYVADDGIGIDPDNRDRVLEEGYTVTGAGTGLGLSIVRQIAAAHGWTVSVTESDDGGARFEFSGVEPATPNSSDDERVAESG
ncbi:histidine kinase N-terminal 7TM domain-containing protein [Natrarchaeobius sp. A-rgal3]|uniref:sensor histidine kinase n=1 Tax=Natrarchaeobius versutus TaxID=1679078 RepID=UPI00350F6DF2